jgi:hypothetical protein
MARETEDLSLDRSRKQGVLLSSRTRRGADITWQNGRLHRILYYLQWSIGGTAV